MRSRSWRSRRKVIVMGRHPVGKASDAATLAHWPKSLAQETLRAFQRQDDHHATFYLSKFQGISKILIRGTIRPIVPLAFGAQTGTQGNSFRRNHFLINDDFIVGPTSMISTGNPRSPNRPTAVLSAKRDSNDNF